MTGVPCASIGGCSGTGFSGFCGITGCLGGCMGTFCGFSGQVPSPQQFYGGWNKFPGKIYYHRDLYVTTGFSPFVYTSLTVIYYPERPSYFYFYDPAQKKYVGRYKRGAKDPECFAMIPPNLRKATLGEVPEKSYARWGPMPAMVQLMAPPQPPTGPSAAPGAGAPALVRPPDTLPGHDLPPDELLDKVK
jgi:hypothetical protein